MTAATYNRSRLAKFYATAEVTYGTSVAHAGTDVMPSEGGDSIAYDPGESPVVDLKEGVAVTEFVEDGEESTTWNLAERDLKPGGAVATPPDLAAFLKAFFGQQNDGTSGVPTVSASPSPTTTGCTLSSASGIAIGTWIRFVGNATAALAGKCRLVTGVATNAITWEPALSEAPASTDIVHIGYGWVFTTENALSLSLFRELENVVDAISGAFADQFTLKMQRNGRVRMSMSGQGCGAYSKVGQSTVGSGYSSAGTSLTVATGHGKRFKIDSKIPLYVVAEAEGANTEEVLLVTAVTGDVLTVTGAQKSTGASDHGVGAVVRPWKPTITVVGSPLPVTQGEFLVDGASMNIHGVNVDSANGFQKRENNLFSRQAADRQLRSANANPRATNLSISGKFTADHQTLLFGAHSRTTHTLLAVAGSTNYARVCLYAKKWRPQVTNQDEGSGEAMFDAPGVCMATSGNDELYIGIV